MSCERSLPLPQEGYLLRYCGQSPELSFEAETPETTGADEGS